MTKPTGINQAVIGIWLTIMLSAIAALVNKWLDVISMEEFIFTIILYAFLCIFPYKINKGSNATRYVYLVFFAISMLFMLAGIGDDMPKIDFILSIILIPVELFIIYRLFQKDSSPWFSQE